METGVTGPDAPTPEAEAPQAERPEWLPDKFKSPEDLVKSYQALEQKLGGQSQQEPSDPELPDEDEAVDQGLQEAEQAVENAGLDFEVLANEYAENGELSQEAYQALQESGIPKNLVNQFIEGQEAKTQLIQREAYSLVGGEQQYNEMINSFSLLPFFSKFFNIFLKFRLFWNKR